MFGCLLLFALTGNLEGLAVELDRAVRMLCHDDVNSVASLQVQQCLI